MKHHIIDVVATGNAQEAQGMTRSSAARPSGGANAWTQPPLSARQPSARTAAPLEPSSIFGGSTKNAKSAVGQKKTLTVSKTSKANARFAQAVPAGVDIMTDDLRGYVLEYAFYASPLLNTCFCSFSQNQLAFLVAFKTESKAFPQLGTRSLCQYCSTYRSSVQILFYVPDFPGLVRAVCRAPSSSSILSVVHFLVLLRYSEHQFECHYLVVT